MTSKMPIRVASALVGLNLVGHVFLANKLDPQMVNNMLSHNYTYLFQPGNLSTYYECFTWGFAIAFGLGSRLLWLLSNATDKMETFASSILGGVLIFLFFLTGVEYYFKYFLSASVLLIAFLLALMAYFKFMGYSIVLIKKNSQIDSNNG